MSENAFHIFLHLRQRNKKDKTFVRNNFYAANQELTRCITGDGDLGYQLFPDSFQGPKLQLDVLAILENKCPQAMY